MKILRIFLFCFAALCCGIQFVSAQSPSATLQRARTAIGGDGAVATFSSYVFDAQGREVSHTSGQISINGHLFRLTYGSITAAYDGKDLVYYDKSENTLTYSRPSTEELAQINPFIFLTDASRAYQIEDLAATKMGPVVGFSPKVRNGIKQFSITFNSRTGLPYTMDGVFDDGSRMSIKILSIETNRKFATKLFKISSPEYPKAEVIDLR